MLDHTRKPPTGMVEIRFVGPAAQAAEAAEALRPFGFSRTEETKDWLDVLPGASPGRLLSGARYREDLTQQQLSQMTGIPRRHISEMEHDKRPIGKEMSKRLAKVLGVGYRVFL